MSGPEAVATQDATKGVGPRGPEVDISEDALYFDPDTGDVEVLMFDRGVLRYAGASDQVFVIDGAARIHREPPTSVGATAALSPDAPASPIRRQTDPLDGLLDQIYERPRPS